MKRKKKLSPKVVNTLSAGSMLPSCMVVSLLIYYWFKSNGWVGESSLIYFVIFGIISGFYSFFKYLPKD